MNKKDFAEVVALIVKDDPRFDRAAYFFVRAALDHTLLEIKKQGNPRQSNHVSGQELLEGIRKHALEQYGPMTFTLFESWGVRRCNDFGDIVFNLIEYGVFGKNEKDKPDDFSDAYDFREAFLQPFLPAKQKADTRA